MRRVLTTTNNFLITRAILALINIVAIRAFIGFLAMASPERVDCSLNFAVYSCMRVIICMLRHYGYT